ncbi:hypothetical protein KA005_18060, partial [bacterium]|nr:hypothetical protein [bacterium]
KFNDVWDLTLGPLQIDFNYDGAGLIDDPANHATAKIGILDKSTNSGVWLFVNYSMLLNTFDSDPLGSPAWDVDDILILQKENGEDQSDYDPSPILGDAYVVPIYFDRDGVTPYQATNPLCINEVTYNTNGKYEISLSLNAVDDNHGVAYMTINGLTQGYIIDTNPYPPPEILPDVEIIVDDSEATYVGDWYPSTLVPGYYLDGYHYSFAGSGSDIFTWAFDLPYGGEWDVFAMWSNRSTRATDSPFTINHADGFDTVYVNQEINGGEWNSLGVYTFNKGESTILLTDDANQAVIADAIKLVLRNMTWPIVSYSPAGITFTGDMKNMQVFYQLDGQGADHVVEFNDLTVQGFITSLQERKEQTIQALSQVQIEEKKIAHRIDQMIEKIGKSVEEKLWEDEYEPSTKHGNKVFDNEKKAVKHGLKIIKDKKTTEEVKETVTQTIHELVSVDLCLAQNKYQQASQHAGTKKVDHELEKAHKYLEKAYKELAKTDSKYDKVINNLKKSWEHSKKALKHAEKLD